MPSRLDPMLQAKLAETRRILRSLESVAVAFSAGVDSTLILRVAIEALGPDRVLAATARSDSLAQAEFEEACRLAADLGVRHVVLDTDEFTDENYLSNPVDRCYHCKTHLYRHLAAYIAQVGIRAMVNGINADDLGDWRPGIQAAREHGVRCPAAEAGLTKEDVRQLSAWYGLANHDKPASPCLSSRVQYGERITPEKLRMIEQAETLLKSLGIGECRVRHHDNLARIEVHPGDMPALLEPQVRQRLDAELRALGYQYVTLDLRGFRSGSMNQVVHLGIGADDGGIRAAH